MVRAGQRIPPQTTLFRYQARHLSATHVCRKPSRTRHTEANPIVATASFARNRTRGTGPAFLMPHSLEAWAKRPFRAPEECARLRGCGVAPLPGIEPHDSPIESAVLPAADLPQKDAFWQSACSIKT